MKSILAALTLLFLSSGLFAKGNNWELEQTRIIEQKLKVFLSGASINSYAIHNEFWADDLVYTSSSGTRFGKTQLMQGVKSAGEVAPQEVKTRYTGEQVQVKILDDVAVLSFELVAKSADNSQIQRYLNSGTFVLENGQWRVTNWQATKKADNDQP